MWAVLEAYLSLLVWAESIQLIIGSQKKGAFDPTLNFLN